MNKSRFSGVYVAVEVDIGGDFISFNGIFFHATVSEKLMVGSLLQSKVTRRGHFSASNRDLVLCIKRGCTLIGEMVRRGYYYYPGSDGGKRGTYYKTMSLICSELLIVFLMRSIS